MQDELLLLLGEKRLEKMKMDLQVTVKGRLIAGKRHGRVGRRVALDVTITGVGKDEVDGQYLLLFGILRGNYSTKKLIEQLQRDALTFHGGDRFHQVVQNGQQCAVVHGHR